MPARSIIFLFLALFLTADARAQQPVQINVYYTQDEADTMKQVLLQLRKQLGQSNKVQLVPYIFSGMKGRGIYLLNKGKEKSQKVSEEKFSVSADGKMILISGNSNLAVQHGVFAWLEALGFRFYFPHPDWHIIPRNPDLFKKYKLVTSPSYLHRRIWYEYGTGSPKADSDYIFWNIANRLGGTLHASFGHAYDDIVLRNKETFLKHPEWFYPPAPKGTLPDDPKFDLANQALIDFIIRDVLQRVQTSLQKKAPLKMISLAPSDGRGICNSEACCKLGSVTDRVFYLVNRAAKAVQEKYPGTYIGCLAYDEYGHPPSRPTEPNVYVGITTAFNTSLFPTTELIRKWAEKKATVGIYDYFSQFSWDFDIPGQSQASAIKKMEKNIRIYHKLGARGYEGQSSMGWISKGLGYYIAAKLMWDVRSNSSLIRKEFFDLCFKKASVPIQRLWQEWENYSFQFVRESSLAGWIDLADQAAAIENDPAVQKRLSQIRSYLHYLFLLRIYQQDKSEQNMLALLNYGYRTLDYGSVIGYTCFFEIGNRSGIPRMGFVPDARWRQPSGRLDYAQINALTASGRKQLKSAPPVQQFFTGNSFYTIPWKESYSKLVKDSAQADNAYWMKMEWVFEIVNPGKNNFLEFAGDYIGDKSVKKPIRISVYPYSANAETQDQQPLFQYDYTEQKVKRKFDFSSFKKGYYTMIIEDPVKIYRLWFSPDIRYSLLMHPAMQIKTTAFNFAFLYVPEQVSHFRVMKTGDLHLLTPAGREIKLPSGLSDETIDVRKGESGLWRIKLLSADFYAEGIPPCIGFSPRRMLVPR